jgi:hypothetical protein
MNGAKWVKEQACVDIAPMVGHNNVVKRAVMYTVERLTNNHFLQHEVVLFFRKQYSTFRAELLDKINEEASSN